MNSASAGVGPVAHVGDSAPMTQLAKGKHQIDDRTIDHFGGGLRGRIRSDDNSLRAVPGLDRKWCPWPVSNYLTATVRSRPLPLL